MLFGLFFWADRECGYDSLRFRRLFAIIGKKKEEWLCHQYKGGNSHEYHCGGG